MGGPQVVDKAMITCSFGVAPGNLTVLPIGRPLVSGSAAATIADCAPMVNIKPFGMCMSLANPTVAAATSAALGVLTPQPCVPVTTPWMPGAPQTLIGGVPALTVGSTCQCAWAGVVTILQPGQMTTMAN